LVCRRPAETVSLQRRQICYQWGTPAYWSLVPRSSNRPQIPLRPHNFWTYTSNLTTVVNSVLKFISGTISILKS
jgi:hypothetical protein